jgi:hypothetical protein
MTQKIIVCKDRRNWNAKAQEYEICANTQRNRNRVYLKEPYSNFWTYGFPSRDRLGIVYYSPFFRRYMFTGVIVEQYNVSHGKRIGGYSKRGSRVPLFFRIEQGREIEKKIVVDLTFAEVTTKYFVYQLLLSGINSHGTDIVISLKEQPPDTYPFKAVREGVCAIEVLGVKHRGKKQDPKLIYDCKKDFLKWRNELINYNVLPVLAWVLDDKCYYVILTDNALFNGMYTNYGGFFHQQKGYLPVSRLMPYAIDNNMLFNMIDVHVKTVNVIGEINRGYGRDYNIYCKCTKELKRYGFNKDPWDM